MLVPDGSPQGRLRAALDAATVDERHDFVAFLFLKSDVAVEDVPRWVQDALASFARRAGVVAGSPHNDDAIGKWFAAHPLSPTLVALWNDAAQDATLGAGPARAAQAFLGLDAKTGVLGGGQRPPGTTPGGLLGQIAARTDTKTKRGGGT